jgi:hypothetical protein
MRHLRLFHLAAVAACATAALWPQRPLAQSNSVYEQAIPNSVRGPFVSRPDVVTYLDCPTNECKGVFAFSRLMEARMPPTERSKHPGNPFQSSVGKSILDTIVADLTKVRASRYAVGQQLNEKFLTDEHSRLELVGIVNRMDRQFVKDPSVGLSKAQQGCGEISLIYRVAYNIRDGKQQSRLPVTLNLVFPALPFNNRNGKITCQEMAKRWLAEAKRPPGRTTAQEVSDLLDPATGPLSTIDGKDILRVELNMQEYRIKAGNDQTRFGTEAAYLFRVFRWNPAPDHLRFEVSYLQNQIDRDKVLNNGSIRRALIDFLSKKDSIASIDAGTIDIPLEFPKGIQVLADRGISMSPGGIHRSANQPFWNANDTSQQIISDPEIDVILRSARAQKIPLSFIQSIEDFRLRLNEQTCTGCHQTRAIAGFHFPGADRPNTPLPNAVLLPGSPLFYGDQPRRMRILEQMAARPDAQLKEFELATSYADRPQNIFSEKLGDTNLIGGWGGACLINEVMATSQRKWTCKGDLECVQLFESSTEGTKKNDGLGTCVPPAGKKQVGDPLQRGRVVTTSFGKDVYERIDPPIEHNDTRIKKLPPDAPQNNSYYGAHQEYYDGNNDPPYEQSDFRDVKRDAKTGGFPAGMLRLSECIGLPAEASCGGIAASGFNDCIDRLADDDNLAVRDCFSVFTAYAGVRACDAATPCRDDYICVKPMGYTPANAVDQYKDRQKMLLNSKLFWDVNKHKYDPEKYYGQKQPDGSWVAKNDQRGLCIPPYFVFQFRADGHPAP